MSDSNYPKAWQRFTAQSRPTDGVVPETLGGKFGPLARWSARFRLAKSFKGLDLGDAYAGSETPQLYAAITRIFLVYSAFETYCDIVGLKPHEEDQVKSLQEPLSQQATLQTIRQIDPQYAIAKFLLEHLKNKKLKQTMGAFIDEQAINVSCFAGGIRHVFAHGILTANASGLSPQRFDQVSQIVSGFLLDCMDQDFDERVP
ncbi:hypothetical protein H6F86_24400 [Phormidium sp. FACHB-592]|uniref:Tetracyclin repressor-like C-terminal domain-containing protein n=1 Tax=Stenomitos frigidus AS-A4 TaxID=2933935 RepID=A0ABV0KKR4_9CYAN|nr:hypothetical protein [Phormidium sp. FACHB-592]MBD2076969.1 hypothetical protein [Phormidium sp. FACHB-592]